MLHGAPTCALLLTALVGAVPARAALQRADARPAPQWSPARFVSGSCASGTAFEVHSDGAIAVRAPSDAQERYAFEFEVDLAPIAALRLEALEDPHAPAGGPGFGERGGFALGELLVEARTSPEIPWRPVSLRRALACRAERESPALHAIDGDFSTCWAVRGGDPARASPRAAAVVLELAQEIAQERPISLRIVAHFPGPSGGWARWRLSASSAAPPGDIASSGCPAAPPPGVQAALDRGVEFLLGQQELDGSWSALQSEYESGQTALSVYTLLECGLAPTHPAVRRGLAFLRAHPPQETYSLACQLLVLGALTDPRESAWAEELTGRLLAWRRPDGYGYPRGDADISNTQFAAMGLRAAAQAGVAIDPLVWRELGLAALGFQTGDGSGAFRYREPDPGTASRTAAGMTILAIACEQLGLEIQGEHAFGAALREGTGWIARNFSVTSNANSREGDAWNYYWLWGLERIAGLLQAQDLGLGDWYALGAANLVGLQRPDGSWSTVTRGEHQSNTCFALLFLQRASRSGAQASWPAQVSLFGKDDPEKDLSLRVAAGSPPTAWISSWGTRSLQELEWPGEEGRGPHVLAVEYWLPGGTLLADGRLAPATWQSAPRTPVEHWTEVDFQPSGWKSVETPLVRRKSGQGEPRSEWRSETSWLRREFQLDVEQVIEPALVVSLREELAAPEGQSASAPRLCLWDEDAAFPDLIRERVGLSAISVQRADRYSGTAALRATPSRRSQAAVPGWGFRITRAPKPGEFRYLRFAWKKTGGAGIMLELAHGGTWGDRTVRYYAGSNESGSNPSIQVSRTMPAEWTVITRDLYEDFGGEAELTGIAFTPMSGEAGLYDALWLGRTKSDLPGPPSAGGGPLLEVAEPLLARVQVWLNGSLVHDGGPTRGYEIVAPASVLRPLLRPGQNVLAVQVDRGSSGLSFDAGISEYRLLARVEPSSREVAAFSPSYSARLPVSRSGSYRLRARALVSPPEGGELAPRWVDSEPLDFTLRDMEDPILLQYATDSARSLLRSQAPRVRASTAQAGFPPTAACDGLQGSAWLSREGDASPQLFLEFDPPLKANRLKLSHPGAAAVAGREACRAFVVEVMVNGRGPSVQLELDMDLERKTTWDLPRSGQVRTLELKILDRVAPRGTLSPVGFAEVELLAAE